MKNGLGGITGGEKWKLEQQLGAIGLVQRGQLVAWTGVVEVVKEMERLDLACGSQVGMTRRVKACGLQCCNQHFYVYWTLCHTHVNYTDL